MTSIRNRFLVALVCLLLAALACDLSIAETILGSIDTSQTDCNQESFEVTVEEDVHDGACNSHCSLRDAIIAANTCEGTNRIELPIGVYTLSLRGAGPEAGDLDITDSVVIQGHPAPGGSLIEGNQGWNHRIFEIHDPSEVSIEDVAIRNGHESVGEGGGILNQSTLRLTDVILSRNEAETGGAIFNWGLANLNRVSLGNNLANYAYDVDWRSDGRSEFPRYPPTGTAISCGGAISNAGRMTVRDSRIENNDAAIGAGVCQLSLPGENIGVEIVDTEIRGNGWEESFASDPMPTIFGGGIATFGPTVVTGGSIEGNAAVNGGGVYLSSRGFGSLQIDGVDISVNNAQTINVETSPGTEPVSYNASGGGIYVHAGTLQIQDSFVRNNGSRYYGAGITIGGSEEAGGARVEILESDIFFNEASFFDGTWWGVGGGILIEHDSAADVELRNVTVSHNRARGAGDGILVAGGRTLQLSHVTIAYNPTVGRGVGLSQTTGTSANITMENSIIGWHEGLACDPGTRINSLGYNLAPAPQCLPGAGQVGTDYGATSLGEVNLRPLVVVAGHRVHPLELASWAFNRIPESECAPSAMVDQTGTARPIGAGCEVGAYEMEDTGETIQSPLVAATPTPEASKEPSKPTVTTDTLCWKGPGALYETVSSLLAGTEVEILGRGEEGDWWVLDNPRYPGVECWTPGEDIEVDPDYTYPATIFPVPPLPTPSPTPILGCLYQDQNQNNPVCYKIEQCPVDFEDSLGACTP